MGQSGACGGGNMDARGAYCDKSTRAADSWVSATFSAHFEAPVCHIVQHFIHALFIAPTMYINVDGVASLPRRRLTPVNSAVKCRGCLDGAAKGSRRPPFVSTDGNLVIRGYRPEDLPSM